MAAESQRLLEELVGAPLPPEYLNVLNDYPHALRSAFRALDESASEGTVADVELIADLQSVVDINLEARSDSVPEPDGLEFFWPNQLLVIGETGGGDYYCIDALNEVSGVIQFDHQSVGFEVVADSLAEFVDMLMETFLENEDTAAAPGETADRRDDKDSGTP